MLKYSFILCLLTTCQLFGQSLDYSKRDNWAVLPADSLPASEYVDYDNYRDIDVFYVYPTLLTSDEDKRWNYDIDDAKHRKDVIDVTVKYQASAWAGLGNLYVPYYRQAHLKAYRLLDEGGKDALLFGYEDIKASFQYYLEHYNQGRPILLAGHSQGTTQLILLMKEFFDGKPLLDQLIAAYLPGIGIEKGEFENIPLMTSADEIGGFVTWNTMKRRYDEDNYTRWYKGKAVVNPVTWDTTSFSKRSKHGGFLYTNGKMYEKSVRVNMIDGALWIKPPKFPYRHLAIFLNSYHTGDINLFWLDIRKNSQLRIERYLNENSKPLITDR